MRIERRRGRVVELGHVLGEVRDAATARGVLVGAADELVDAYALTLVAAPQTQRTYRRACRRLVDGLGPLAGPEDLTAANVADYHAQLVAGGLASSTVKKERAAVNSFLRWLVEFEHIAAGQARRARRQLPRAEQAAWEMPKALTGAQYDVLLQAARAAIVNEPLAGARDLAMLLVLGDAGLRCEELAGLDRSDLARRLRSRRRARSRHRDRRQAWRRPRPLYATSCPGGVRRSPRWHRRFSNQVSGVC